MEQAPLSDQERRSDAARELSVLWWRIGSQHLAAAQGCSCGFGGVMIQAADFEIDIVEFLIGDARKSGMHGIERYIKAVAGRGDDCYSLPVLLDAIGEAGNDTRADPDEIEFILARLHVTLTSIEAAHNKSRFVCD